MILLLLLLQVLKIIVNDLLLGRRFVGFLVIVGFNLVGKRKRRRGNRLLKILMMIIIRKGVLEKGRVFEGG